VRRRGCASTFVQGRLTVDELDERTAIVSPGTHDGRLRRAMRACRKPFGASVVQAVVRGAALVVLTGAWLAFKLRTARRASRSCC